MILGERIKKVRRSLDLTQQEFGGRIGIKPNSISLIESGNRNASEQVVLAVCREFNVSEVWLRTGEGEMIVPKEADALDELVKQYGLSDGDHVLIEKFLKLKPVERQAVIAYMQEVVAALNAGTAVISKNETTTPAPTATGQEQTEAERDENLKKLILGNGDELEDYVREHKKNLNAWQEQQIMNMMKTMIASQKQPLFASGQESTDEKAPKTESPDPA